MKNEDIKDTIFKKGVKSIPNFVWIFCASYALIMLTNLFVLNFAHIDADKHINRYLDILLTNKENSQQCDPSIINQINTNTDSIKALTLDNEILKENSHEPAK